MCVCVCFRRFKKNQNQDDKSSLSRFNYLIIEMNFLIENLAANNRREFLINSIFQQANTL